MSTGLLSQLDAYYSQVDEMQDPIHPDEVAALLDTVKVLPSVEPSPMPGRNLRRGVWVAVAAVVVVMVLVGGLAWLTTPPEDEVIDQSTTSTTIESTSVPPVSRDAGGVVGPGWWSVAATFPSGALAVEQLAETVALVETWPGVLGVVEVADEAAWERLTGLKSACEDGEGAGLPPCGPGIAALTTSPWMQQTAERLRTELDMAAVTALDVSTAFLSGYIVRSEEPAPLDFDTSSLGLEVPWDTQASLYPDGRFDYSDLSTRDLLIDSSGQGGVMADLELFTGLDAAIGPRRVYSLAWLPVDAAVVTFELADGTQIWQRPIGGRVLFVDTVGSVPELFRDYYDQDYEAEGRDPSELEELGPAKPLVVLNSVGDVILRIEGGGNGPALSVANFRLDPDVLLEARETLAPGLPEPTVSNPVSLVGEVLVGPAVGDPAGVPFVAGDSIWLSTGGREWAPGSCCSSTPTELLRIDAATLEVNAAIEVSGWVQSERGSVQGVPHVAAGALWAVDWETGLISRIDLESARVTDTLQPFELDYSWMVGSVYFVGETLWMTATYFDPDSSLLSRWYEIDLARLQVVNEWQAGPPLFLDSVFEESLQVVDGALWGTNEYPAGEPMTLWRLELSSGEYEQFATGVPYRYEGECCFYVDNAVWLVGEELTRFDLTTRRVTDTVRFDGVTLANHRVLANGALWLPVQHGEGPDAPVSIYRFDPTTKQVTDVVPIGPGAFPILLPSDDELWVFNWVEETLLRIDYGTRKVTHIVQASRGGTVFDGAFWVVSDGHLTRTQLP